MHARITADGKLASSENPAELRRLFQNDLVAEIHLVVCPVIGGRRRAPTLGGEPGEYFLKSIRCRLLKMEVQGSECFLHYRVLRPTARRAGPRASGKPRGAL